MPSKIFRGKFLLKEEMLQKKLSKIKAFVFDWDGVFTNGTKYCDKSTDFNEKDTMGINMLRFSFFLKHKLQCRTAIITGENNPTAKLVAQRENFDCLFYLIKNKPSAIDFFCKKFSIQPENILYAFDDVADISVAKMVGLRVMINSLATPMFSDFMIKNKLADYITNNEGNNGAVREMCEMIMMRYKNFDKTILNRSEFSEVYQQYWNEKTKFTTEFYTANKQQQIISEI